MSNLLKLFMLFCLTFAFLFCFYTPLTFLCTREISLQQRVLLETSLEFVLPQSKIADLSRNFTITKFSLSSKTKTVSKRRDAPTATLYTVLNNGSHENLTTNADQTNQIGGNMISEHFYQANRWGRLVNGVNCRALIQDDKTEQTRTYRIIRNETLTLKTGEYYINVTRNCKNFKLSLGYVTLPVNSVEENFPLAFSILMYKDIEQVERLLRAVYRPQNVYCVHIDQKAMPEVKRGMEAIAGCFDNVYIVPNPSNVRWGTFTVLEPELKCINLLWTKKKWKYYINLTGQEFPLKTNLELVRILQAFNGANNVDDNRRMNWENRWSMAGRVPHGIKPTKGAVHIVVSRGYVDYLLHNPLAKDILKWVQRVIVPDEVFFNTLNHNPQLGVPGSYKGEVENYTLLTRYKVWLTWGDEICHGIFVRNICIFGIRDLPRLTSVPHLFANKLHWDYQHYALDCLEEWHFNKTREELIHPSTLNLTFYEELPFVKLATRP